MALSTLLEGAWIAVQVRPRSERIVATQLGIMGYEHYLPMYARRRTPGSARLSPLFPGYVFCRYSVDNPNRIVRVSAVVRLVGTDRGPLPLPEHEVEGIRRVTTLQLPVEPWPNYQPGERIRVVSGPLSGIEGTLVYTRKHWRLVLAVSALQRGVAVEVHVRDVEAFSTHDFPLPANAAACYGVDH